MASEGVYGALSESYGHAAALGLWSGELRPTLGGGERPAHLERPSFEVNILPLQSQ